MEPVTKPTEALHGLETPPRWGCMNNNERLFLFHYAVYQDRLVIPTQQIYTLFRESQV